MPDQLETKKERVEQIGPDRVTITDEEVVIEARHKIPDWEVRDFHVIPIYFADKKYFLVEKRKAAPPYAARYLLQPWKDGLVASSKLFHTYDLEAVQERESSRRRGMRDELGRAYLLLFYPFLGLFWSGTQKRLIRFGFVPHTISGVSVFTVFSLLFAQGVFAVVLINASARTGKMMLGGMLCALSGTDTLQLGPLGIPLALLDTLLSLAFLADAAMRYSCYLRESEWSGGFLEWLVPTSLRKNKPS